MTDSNKYCTFCGAQLTEAGRFCIQCGAPVDTDAPAQPTQPIEEPVYTGYSYAIEQEPVKEAPKSAQFFDPYVSMRPEKAIPKAKNRLPVWLIVLLVGLVICLCVGCLLSIGLGTYFFRTQKITSAISTDVRTQEEYEAIEPLFSETDPFEVKPSAPAEEVTSPHETVFPGREVNVQGIHFYLNDEIAQDVFAEVVPATTGQDLPEWEVSPEYIDIKFYGYQSVDDTFHQPRLIIFPADEYAKISPWAAEIITNLKHSLTSYAIPTSDELLPFLPTWNAGQVFHANESFVDFQNGSGIRYLTQYAQDVYPINNYSLFYTFQGLTDDGRFYVTAIFPVSTPVLPDPETIDLDEEFYDNYSGYIEDTIFLLDTLPGDTFTPSLIDLDLLVESLSVEK